VSSWNAGELGRIAGAEELELVSRRPDDSLSPSTVMWDVRVGDDVFVRSARGPGGAWYRRARRCGRGQVSAGGVEREVTFTDVPASQDATHAAVDHAYHAKYDRYGPRIVGSVVGAAAAGVTLRLDPTG
jgi:hypothetical protein